MHLLDSIQGYMEVSRSSFPDIFPSHDPVVKVTGEKEVAKVG